MIAREKDRAPVKLLPENYEMSAWLRGIVGTVSRRVDGKRVKSCRHQNAVQFALWAPDRISCAECFPLAPAGPVVCDKCGVISEDAQMPAAVSRGLNVWFLLCPGCVEIEFPGRSS